MIISNINSKHNDLYKKIHKSFDRAFSFLKGNDLENLSDGRYDISGEDIYAVVSSYETKPDSERKFEVHEKYIDLQAIIKGEEIIGFESEENLTSTSGDGNDIKFFLMPKKYDSVKFESGKFAIIFPGEPHAPGISSNGNTNVRKIVIKIKM